MYKIQTDASKFHYYVAVKHHMFVSVLEATVTIQMIPVSFNM